MAGVGSAGVTGGSFIIIAHIAPMEQRPMYQSLTGGMFGIASIIAPLVSTSDAEEHTGVSTVSTNVHAIGRRSPDGPYQLALVFLD